MNAIVRKTPGAMELLMAGLVAAFAARATASVVEGALIRRTPLRDQVARLMTESRTAMGTVQGPRAIKDTRGIVERNISCSRCDALGERPKPKDEPASVAVAEPARSSLPLRLVAIMFSPPPHDPRRSLAVIRDTNNRSTGPFAAGATLRGATIESIEPTRVHLRREGKVEFLDLIDPPSEARAHLELYTKLRSASHLAVALLRQGQKLTQDYAIR